MFCVQHCDQFPQLVRHKVLVFLRLTSLLQFGYYVVTLKAESLKDTLGQDYDPLNCGSWGNDPTEFTITLTSLQVKVHQHLKTQTQLYIIGSS